MALTLEFKKRFARNTLENVVNAVKNAGILAPNRTYIFRGEGVYIELKTLLNPVHMKFRLCVYRPENPHLEPFCMESNVYPSNILN